MDKVDNLLIRACKADNPDKRLKSVYRRFYGNYPDPEQYLVVILSRICDLYLEFPSVSLTNHLLNSIGIYSKKIALDKSSIIHETYKFFRNKIRFSCRDDFPKAVFKKQKDYK
jgi:hypothetical protein